MLGRIFPIISSVILIAIYIFLFNLSLPKISGYLLSNKIHVAAVNMTKNFLGKITVEEKQALLNLPCGTNSDLCPDSKSLKDKYIESFNDELASRVLILSSDGREIFTGRNLDAKYTNLIETAKSTGKAHIIEKVQSNSGSERRYIAVEKISDIANDTKLSDKFLLLLVDEKSVNLSLYKILLGLLAITPLLISIFYFVLTSKKTIHSKNKIVAENKDYISQIENLKRENVQQSQFLANFTHELRTPLNSIIGFSGLLKDQTLGPLGNSEYVKYSNDINTSGVHLLSLINDILDYSKSEVGKLKINVTEVDIVKIIKQSLSIVSPRASESKVELLQSFASEYFIVRTDPKRLKQILLNLLSNSVKFTPEGGNVTVSVFPDIKGDKVSIEVKDTGVGIAEKDIPTVMSLFGQVETDLNRKYEGTGIGLPFAKKLTQLMGGTFDLQSQVGVGTKVILTFPYDKKLNAEYAELYKKSGSDNA